MSEDPAKKCRIHETAVIDDNVEIGEGTSIWHFAHIIKGSVIGKRCTISQNVVVGPDVVVGDGVKIQNNVSVFKGVTLQDNVFCGPSMVFTNVYNPRAEIPRMTEVMPTVVKRGATLGANCTVVCGVTIGRYALIGAGAVVKQDVPDYALIVGVPGRQAGWVSRHGYRMAPGDDGIMTCPESGYRYREEEPGVVKCMDLDEDAPLPG